MAHQLSGSLGAPHTDLRSDRSSPPTIPGLGTVPLAAHYLTNQTEGMNSLPAYGFSYTATALIGQSLGAGRKDLADRFALSICLIGSAVIVLACIPVAIWSWPYHSPVQQRS
ncbi:MAG: MATE family efflux transporter [Lachnospiraceae bacterium]